MTFYQSKKLKLIGYMLAFFIILAALVASVTQLLNPFFNRHLPDLEVWASNYFQVPLKVDRVKVSWHWLGPEILFQQVSVLDQKTKKPKLKIQQVEIDLSLLRSLFSWRIAPESFVVSGVHLNVHQKPTGQLNVGGLLGINVQDTLTGASLQTEQVAAQIFSQPRLGLRDIEIRYIDANKVEKSLTLKALTLRNSSTQHLLKGRVVLNQDIPTKVNIVFQWKGNVLELEKVKAKLYFYVEGLSLAQWLKKMSWEDLQIKQGLISAKIWADWDENQWQKIQSSFQLYGLELMFGSRGQIPARSTLGAGRRQETQSIERLSGNVGWRREGDKQIFAGDEIFIDLPDHLWPTTNFAITVLPTTDGKFSLQHIKIGYLNLNDVKKFLLNSSILSNQNRQDLTSLNPRGEIKNLDIAFSGELTDLMKIVLGVEVSNLTLAPWNQMPGIGNLSGKLKWDGKQGNFTLNSRQTSVTLNRVFENALGFDQLLGSIDWKKDDSNVWTVKTKKFQVENSDLHVTADAVLTLPEKNSPSIDLAGDFVLKNVAHATRYLPLKIFEADLVQWLKQAFLSGQVESGKVILQGKLSDYPFDTAPGNFMISGDIKNINMNFAPGWPGLKGLMGKLTFSKNSMAAEIDSGQMLNIPITRVKALIASLGGAEPSILSIDSLLQDDLNAVLDFIRHSPLQKTIGKDLTGINLSGPVQLTLGLAIPLENPDATKVTGSAVLSSATLNLPQWNLVFDRIDGTLNFTENEVKAKDLRGLLFDEPATLSLTTLNKDKTSFIRADISSRVSIPVLQNHLSIPLDRVLTGVVNYQAQLMLPHAQPGNGKITVRSDLKGIDIDLPAPFGKNSHQANNFLLEVFINQNQFSNAKLSYANSTATIGYQKSKQGLRTVTVDLSNDMMAGQVVMPIRSLQQGIKADFQYIRVPESAAKNTLSINPESLPPLSLTVNDFRYGDKKFGRVMLTLVPVPKGSAIKQLNINSVFLKLNASGEWIMVDKQHKTHLQGNAKTNNVRGLLNQWGFPTTSIVLGQGDANFNLTWSDTLFNPTLSDMVGSLSLNLGAGRVVNVGSEADAKLGIVRMLNLFSLQTLPRRLSLNFSDLVQKGYSFDYMRGTFDLREGDAFTENMRFDGPAAQIDIAGNIGLEEKSYDLTMSVTPHVSPSLPVAATLAIINPIAGLASLAMEPVLSRSRLVTYYYTVKGTWDNPVWKEVKFAPRR